VRNQRCNQEPDVGWDRLRLLAGDVLAVLAFVVVGQIFHNTLTAPDAFSRTVVQVVSIGAPFVLLAWSLGAYPAQPPAARGELWWFLQRSALAWLFAIPAGLFVRAWLLGQPTVLMAFFWPALASSAPFVLGWRLAYAVLSRSPRVTRAQRRPIF
jgi:hypothetical protein